MRLSYDTELLAAVWEKLARAVMQEMRRAVKQRHGLASVTSLHAGVMGKQHEFHRPSKVGGRTRWARARAERSSACLRWP